MKVLRYLLSAAALSAALLPSAALASGTVRIQQSSGQLREYHHVGLVLHGNALRIVSPDRVGTLIVGRAACVAIGGLQRCLPTSLILSQHGTHRILFQRGTIYFNLSNEPHAMPHSSRIVDPHGVVGLLETMHGTFISIRGQLDEVKP